MSSDRYALKAKYDFRRFRSLSEYIDHVMQEKGLSRTDARAAVYRIIPLENFYQRGILNALRQEFPEGRFRKVAQGFASASGEPDLDGVVNGKYVAVEVKRPLIGEATPLQKKAVRGIRQAGGCSMIASYPDEVVAAVYAHLNGEPYWYELTGCVEAVAEGEDEYLE